MRSLKSVSLMLLVFVTGCGESLTGPCDQPPTPSNLRLQYRADSDPTRPQRLYVLWENSSPEALYSAAIQYEEGCVVTAQAGKGSSEVLMGQVTNCGRLKFVTVKASFSCGSENTAIKEF